MEVPLEKNPPGQDVTVTVDDLGLILNSPGPDTESLDKNLDDLGMDLDIPMDP